MFGSIIGSITNAVVGSKMAKKQAQAIQQGADKSNTKMTELFNQGMDYLNPYMQAGTGALQAWQQAAMQEQSPFSFDYTSYFNSPEYAALSGQAQQQALSSASATGGLRSGNSQVALAAIAPQLAQQARQNAMSEYQLNQAGFNDRFNRLGSVANMGYGAANQGFAGAQNLGVNMGNNIMTAAGANADKYKNYASLAKGLITDLSGNSMPGSDGGPAQGANAMMSAFKMFGGF